MDVLRTCLRDPIPEIWDAARFLDAAVSAHHHGDMELAERLIRLADMPAIREWTESLWGPKSPYVKPRKLSDTAAEGATRHEKRMPSKATLRELLRRDGHHCRFCGIPVIRAEVRQAIKRAYPSALQWERPNALQHAAFQAMWVQYDHLVPHARGGTNDLDNMIVTCAPCNNARWYYLVEEVGLLDPRTRDPVRSTWDGLERFGIT